MSTPANRRRFPRVAAPVLYRPAGPAWLHHRRATVNMSPGGMRIYSDEEMRVGDRVELDLFLTEDSTVRCWARIAWIDPLPHDAGAAFDVGLEFTDMTDDDRRALDELLRRQ